ncbi:MAG: hypothetical protein AAGA85_05295 [Bacteroidota bacterium]
MLKWALTMGMSCVLSIQLAAQLKKFYSLDEVTNFDTVNFDFVATSGHSYWRLVPQDNPLLIYGNPDLEKINPSFDAIVTNRKCDVMLRLEEYRSSGLGDGLAFAMLGSSPSEHDDNYWKVLLNNEKVYNLDLHFGIGTSDIDLSGAKVQCLKVKTGSADVKLNYDGENPNLCQMDSLNVEVDMGSFTTGYLDHAQAKYISCKIGFGSAVLDFTSPPSSKCEVKANVGLGSLEVYLPREEPVIIYLNDSPFRGLNVTKDFEEVEKNVFINRAYDEEAENLLTFRVDVSLGSIDFQYAD